MSTKVTLALVLATIAVVFLVVFSGGTPADIDAGREESIEPDA